jgi:hypothetical protein
MVRVTWFIDGKMEMSLEYPLHLAQRLVKLCLSPVLEIKSGGEVIGYEIHQGGKIVVAE